MNRTSECRWSALLRTLMGAIVTATLLGRPAQLESVRWWRSSAIATSLGLSEVQNDGQYDEQTLQQTQEMIKAAADERAMTRILNDEVAALLSPAQRRMLSRLRPGRVVE